MSRPSKTYVGRVIGQPTTHHVSSYGNPAKQFIILAPGATDAIVAITAANASIGFAIGNAEYRERDHEFLFDGRGKVYAARPVDGEAK